MLSKDEISDGMTFLLKLRDADGLGRFWVETLRGDTAKRWYDIYRNSNWEVLRTEARDVFHRSITEVEAEAILTSRHRRIYIHTDSVTSNELAVGTGSR
jgi:hypothetical protein